MFINFNELEDIIFLVLCSFYPKLNIVTSDISSRDCFLLFIMINKIYH